MASTKTAAKPKAAPVEQADTPEVELPEVGAIVRFLGYQEGTPEEEQVLNTEDDYEVVGYEDDEQEGQLPIVRGPNPNFDAKKKANAKTNPEFIESVCFPEELEVIEVIEGEAEEEVQEEAEEAPAPAKGKAAAKAATKPAAKADAKGKGKAETKAPAKGKADAKPAKGKAAAKKEEPAPEPEEVVTDVPDLDQEDESVLSLVNEAEDLVALVQEMEGNVALTEFQIGGILYHLKRDAESWQSLDPRFAEDGGWKLFVESHFNLGYRKATHLIDIYVSFNQAGLENAAEIVGRLGWTKASKMCKLIVDEEVNADELIQLADETAANDLTEVLKTTYHEGGTGGDKGTKKQRKIIKLKFEQEEGDIVEDILSEACEQLGAANYERALLNILMQWRAENIAGAAEEEEEAAEEAPAPTRKAGVKPAATGKAAASKPASKPATKPAGRAASRK